MDRVRTNQTPREVRPSDFNYRMVTVARQARGFTQGDLKDASGLSVARISKIENGLLHPTDKDLSALSRALKYPIGFFRSDQVVTAVGQSIYHRMRKSMPKKKLDEIEANLNIRHFHFRALLNSAELETFDLPTFDIDDYEGPEQIAQQVRSYWRIPRGPIHNLTEVLESKGVIVVRYDFRSRRIDGETISDGKHPPVVFINTAVPWDRARWTLSHELAHYVIHTLPSPEMEKEADQFAAEFLTPRDELEPMFSGKLTMQKLYDLKMYWRVAMSALLRRAFEFGVIDSGQRQYWWRRLNSEGYLKREPGSTELPPEYPSTAKNLVDFHLKNLGYTLSELCDLLKIEESEFRSAYLSSGRPLFVVS